MSSASPEHVVELLATLFRDRHSAESVLTGAGFPPARMPLFGNFPNAGLFWAEAVRLADDGLIADGVNTILHTARRERPGSRELAGLLGTRAEKVWAPEVVYPLQPAPHFAGRVEVLADLTHWARDAADPNRVVALVAPGGTGKTALAERVLDSLRDFTAAGVFVWSFYENQQTEAFLRAACEYILGSAPTETGGLLERLQRGLTGDAAHLFILDGLELVQAEGHAGRPRGELEDPLMKRFVRWLAAGYGTRAKALITTRFPLPDLTPGRGFRPIDLSDLDAPAARAVFRKWGVTGTDAVLDSLGDQVHRHALTVDVLGSYLGTFHAGDPKQAPSFAPEFLADTDPKTAKLHRVLTNYAEQLQPKERDLLSRLAMFPRGVGTEILGHVVAAGGEVAGSLAGCTQAELIKYLERLRALGLVFRYQVGGDTAFTAHPFLRGFFEKLTGVGDPRQIHEAVRARLDFGLEVRVLRRPRNPQELDRYENLVEVTRLSGHTQQAFDLYWFGLGTYRRLAAVLGEYARGLRILQAFSPTGIPESAATDLPETEQARLLADWGLYATALGDLAMARRVFSLVLQLDRKTSNIRNLSIDCQLLANIDSLAGHWPKAHRHSVAALREASEAADQAQQRDACTHIGFALNALGRVGEAESFFAGAQDMEDRVLLVSIPGLRQAEFELSLGRKEIARNRTRVNREESQRAGWRRDEALCDALLGRCFLPEHVREASRHLHAARSFADRSGHIEITLRCYHLAAEIARHERVFGLAVTEVRNGIELADSCGFGRWSLDIRTELARIHLDAGNPREAVEPAEWVLNRSREPDCQYAWGIADSLYLLGVAHDRLGDAAAARAYLQQAVEARRPLEHPGLAETEAELARLGG